MTTAERLKQLCRRSLGRCRVSPGPVGLRSQSQLAYVTDACGRRYIVKVHSTLDKHRREVHAYTHWTVPALGCHAPRLIAVDAALPGILVTAVPGEPADRAARQPQAHLLVHRQAGALLRRLHDAEPATPLPDFAARLADRLDWWLAAANDLLTAAEQHLVRRHVAALADLPPPRGVPCHLDYQPHNWLIDHTGALRIVDFEHARIDAAPRDLVRLAFRHWSGHPDRRAAFLAGYGRPLSDAEQRLLTHCAALDVVTCLVRARDTANHTLAGYGHATLRQLPPPP